MVSMAMNNIIAHAIRPQIYKYIFLLFLCLIELFAHSVAIAQRKKKEKNHNNNGYKEPISLSDKFVRIIQLNSVFAVRQRFIFDYIILFSLFSEVVNVLPFSIHQQLLFILLCVFIPCLFWPYTRMRIFIHVYCDYTIHL